MATPRPESDLAAIINLELLWEAAFVLRCRENLAARDLRCAVEDKTSKIDPSVSLSVPHAEEERVIPDAISAVTGSSEVLPGFALASPSPNDTYWKRAIGTIAFLLLLSLAGVVVSHKGPKSTPTTSRRASAKASFPSSPSPPDLSAKLNNKDAKTVTTGLALTSSKLTNGYVVRETLPDYPELAREHDIQGPVIVDALVGTDGAVKDLRLVSGDPLLENAATAAVGTWRFRPYFHNGKAAEFRTTIILNFTLR